MRALSRILIAGCLTTALLHGSAPAEAASVPDHFSDSFDRPDGPLGEGWSAPYGVPKVVGGRLFSDDTTAWPAELTAFSARGAVLMSADASAGPAMSQVVLSAATEGGYRLDASIGDWDGNGTFDHLRLTDGTGMDAQLVIPPTTSAHLELRVDAGAVTFVSEKPGTGARQVLTGTTVRSGTGAAVAMDHGASLDNLVVISTPDPPYVGEEVANVRAGLRSATVWVEHHDVYDFAYDDGGSPVTACRVWAIDTTDNSTSPAVTVDACDGTWVTLHGLVPGHAYQLRSRATNAAGTGPLGYGPNVTPYGEPGAPTGLEVVPAALGARLTWAAPASDGGSPVTRYLVDVFDGGGSLVRTVSTTATELAVGELTGGSAYHFRVRAVNTAPGDAAESGDVVALLALAPPTAVKVSGTAKVGVKLTAVPGTWGPSPVTLGYQWSAGGTPIPGATGATFVPTAAQYGKTLTVTVSGSKSGYETVRRTSAATAKVVAGTLTRTTPKVTGTPRVGYRLTAAVTAWKPSGVRLAYQWLSDGKAIRGATARTLTVPIGTVGHRISVKVTGTLSGYTSAARTSARTAVVKK